MFRCSQHIFLAISLFGFNGITRSQEAAPTQAIKEAVSQYEKTMQQAKDTLVADIKKKLTAAQSAGDLKLYKTIELELSQFESVLKLPTCVPVRTYESTKQRAINQLSAAYKDTIEKCTKKGRIAEAEAINAELELFRKSLTQTALAVVKAEPDPRELWIGQTGYFMKGPGRDWFENWNTGNADANLFVETQRTNEFIEMKHNKIPVWLRLTRNRVLLRDERAGQTDFVNAQEGGWQPKIDASLTTFDPKELVGTWRVNAGDFSSEWAFDEKGFVKAQRSTIRGQADAASDMSGRWALNTELRCIVISWEIGVRDGFYLPINDRLTRGAALDRQFTSIMAFKIDKQVSAK